MTRLLGITLALYVPHVAEEALTSMHDDALIVRAFEPLAALAPRHAAYLTFQAMLVLLLATAYLFALGGKARLFVMTALGLSLLAEGHHMVRSLIALQYGTGLATSLAMPFFGAYVLREVARRRHGTFVTRAPSGEAHGARAA